MVLDDQDLMCRLYRVGAFHYIPEVLYLQRMHGVNTQRDAETNAYIQTETVRLYDTYIEGDALAWARRNRLHALDLGAAHNRPAGYLGVDQYPGPDVDIVATLPERLDLPDDSVGVIRAVDFLEHGVDKVSLINELHRVLAPGGLLLSMTPSTDGRGAFQHPTHVVLQRELVLLLHLGRLPALRARHHRQVAVVAARHALPERVAPEPPHLLRHRQPHRHQGRQPTQRRAAAGLTDRSGPRVRPRDRGVTSA
ncbi:methyltransferase domain-containing protein [Agilicoccus flavus]|uniref:methyltransferase domain-containing protein n=1 Tax=Agilicoccus flavus TaxID=2775968 RepID=UPI001CF681F7|nr:methyltransferase domain-containing protein [Agilicoccus flavus]